MREGQSIFGRMRDLLPAVICLLNHWKKSQKDRFLLLILLPEVFLRQLRFSCIYLSYLPTFCKLVAAVFGVIVFV